VKTSKHLDLLLPACCLAVVWAACCLSAAERGAAARKLPPGDTIDSPRALSDALLIVEQRYGKAIFYEDPVWQWQGDVDLRGQHPGEAWGWWLKMRHFTLPRGLDPKATPELSKGVVENVLGAYHEQNSDGTTYRVVDTPLGPDVVPLSFHDSSGAVVAATPVLDTVISVPFEARMPSEHLEAFCAAVRRASGIRVDPGADWMDEFFAANKIVPPRSAAQLLSRGAKAPFSFLWGAEAMPAREALLKLLDQSATTLRWRLLCRPSAKAADRFCILNIAPPQLGSVGPDGSYQLDAHDFDRRPNPARSPSLMPRSEGTQ
jgi:hypothetical protein